MATEKVKWKFQDLKNFVNQNWVVKYAVYTQWTDWKKFLTRNSITTKWTQLVFIPFEELNEILPLLQTK